MTIQLSPVSLELIFSKLSCWVRYEVMEFGRSALIRQFVRDGRVRLIECRRCRQLHHAEEGSAKHFPPHHPEGCVL